MSETATQEQLLETCAQDLHAARTMAAERLGPIVKAAGSELAPVIEQLRSDYSAEAGEFEQMDFDLDGPENLWMAGIMDDAERDTQTIKPGNLLDTALIGAVRKALAADAVSLETAVAVAKSLGQDDVGGTIEDMRGRARQNDAKLQRLLHEIA